MIRISMITRCHFYRLRYIISLFLLPLSAHPMLMRQLLYTSLTITDPRIISIVTSEAFQRLEKVRQYGIDSEVLPEQKHSARYSRADHSLGVYYILSRYNASFEEQVAGLLHDASHTAFSHVGDNVFMHKDGKNSYQDDHHVEFLRQTDLPKVLHECGLELDDVDHKKAAFTCLEQPLPDICADRLEYNLSGGILEGLITCQEALEILDHLRFEDNRWYFIDIVHAKKFAHISLWHTEHIWGCQMSSYVSEALAEAIRKAFELDIITPQEFIHGTDDAVWTKLCCGNSTEIDGYIQKILNAHTHKEEICSAPRTNKFRGINPWVLIDGRYARLTDLDVDFEKEYHRVQSGSYA